MSMTLLAFTIALSVVLGRAIDRRLLVSVDDPNEKE